MRVPISAYNNTGNQFFYNNRYQHLRGNSPSPYDGNDKNRSRSQSVKRKNADEVSYASVAGASLAPVYPICPTSVVEEATVDIAKVNSLCDKIASLKSRLLLVILWLSLSLLWRFM